MNRHSILVKLNVLFAVAILATLIAAFSMGMHSIKKDVMELFFKSRLILSDMRTFKQVPEILLKELHFTELLGEEKREVLKHAHTYRGFEKHMPKDVERRLLNFKKTRKILTYQGYRYLLIQTKGMKPLLLRENKSLFQRSFTPFIFFLSILGLLLWMYAMLRKNLLPLKALHADMVKYGEEELEQYKHSDKQDEVSLVGNAFYASAKKLQVLKDSRQLFVRNIFHELNTPVTKGKILAEVVDDPKSKKMLDSIFTRLSHLLKELTQMEQVISQSYVLKCIEVPIIELLDEASDLLYLEHKIKTNVTDEVLFVDFKLMSIVFKNLIDNAHKYGSSIEVNYQASEIVFTSIGKPMDKPLSHYTEAFVGSGEGIEKGFGLGLYIIEEILSKHDMMLHYEHTNGNNHFIIKFSNRF